MAIPIATGSLVLDVYILILPMIVLWNLRVTRSKRLGLAAIFGVGFLYGEETIPKAYLHH